MKTAISNFFYPETVCVAGASTKEKSIGYELLNSIRVFGYRGKVFPVNPKADEILGYKCFRSINEIKEKIDLAVVVVPKRFVEDTVAQLLEKGSKAIIVVTAGFKETGEEGAAAEERLLALARKYRARLVGPNCMGVINALPEIKLNATFVAEKPESSPAAFLSQSGALGAAVINSLRESDIRFAHFISVGNKADINENDLLAFWEKDKNIAVTTFYLESFSNGLQFVLPFLEGKMKKPAIVLKAGRSAAGMKAAASHTGALGSEDKTVDAVLKQAGIIRAETIDEMFNTVKGFNDFKLPKGNKIAIVTNAGGPAILATDALEKEGLRLAEFSESTKRKLAQVVPREGSKNNPVDLLPGATAEIYKKTNEIVVADKNVDAVISIFVEPVMVAPLPVVSAVNSVNSRKPVYQVVMPLPEFWAEYKTASENYKPLFRTPEAPAKVIANLLFFAERKSFLKKNGNDIVKRLGKYNTKKIKGSGLLRQREIYSLAKKYKLPVVENIYAEPKKLSALKEIPFPVALKGINYGVSHKSDLGAVKLDVKTKSELKKSAKEISEAMKKRGYAVDEFLIQPFVKAKHELLIGGYRDSSFGPVIMFGQGGKYVEQYDDTQLRSAFLTEADALEMIAQTKIGKIIGGVRGEKSADLKKLAQIILRAAAMLSENENLAEFDINPLVLTDDGKFAAVDIRVKLSE